MKKYFLADFEGCNEQQVRDAFEDGWYTASDNNGKHGDLGTLEVLFAWYGAGDYDGSAFVLCRDRETGSLYEVNGGHCSCYGLEGQWEPELTSIVALRHRIECGSLGHDQYYDGGCFGKELTEVLDSL